MGIRYYGLALQLVRSTPELDTSAMAIAGKARAFVALGKRDLPHKAAPAPPTATPKRHLSRACRSPGSRTGALLSIGFRQCRRRLRRPAVPCGPQDPAGDPGPCCRHFPRSHRIGIQGHAANGGAVTPSVYCRAPGANIVQNFNGEAPATVRSVHHRSRSVMPISRALVPSIDRSAPARMLVICPVPGTEMLLMGGLNVG